mmetsp:Transcript_32205/g.77917  ORF Transcript_32205/g.77917 Transcript_32205/m.77917 type:complete len:83 (-) Transcript_32205:30-278(-)
MEGKDASLPYGAVLSFQNSLGDNSIFSNTFRAVNPSRNIVTVLNNDDDDDLMLPTLLGKGHQNIILPKYILIEYLFLCRREY